MSKKILYGIITKKNRKTIKVTVNKRIACKKYKKYINRKKNYIVHCCYDIDSMNIKNKVKIIESIPKSKLKKWEILKIIR